MSSCLNSLRAPRPETGPTDRLRVSYGEIFAAVMVVVVGAYAVAFASML